MEIREKFLQIFHELLQDANLSVLAFSRLVGIDARVIRRWIKNGSPNLESLIKIADFSNCSLDYLIGKSIYFEYVKSENSTNFQARYNDLKKSSKLKDIEIARLCSVSKGTVSKWKIGRIPNLFTLEKLCNVFGCSFDYLVGRAD